MDTVSIAWADNAEDAWNVTSKVRGGLRRRSGRDGVAIAFLQGDVWMERHRWGGKP